MTATAAQMVRMLARVEQAHPRASLLYARILLLLSATPGQALHTADIGERLNRGRNSSAVQGACANLEQLGLIQREDGLPRGGQGQRVGKIVRLVNP